MKHLLTLAVFSLALAACNATPEAGDSCSPENFFVCASASQGLICESGTLRAFPCPGPNGCVDSGPSRGCDFSGVKEGDACPKHHEGDGQCIASNANQALVCKGGAWAMQTCNSCIAQGLKITCQP